MAAVILHVLPASSGLSTAFDLDVTHEGGRGIIAGVQAAHVVRLLSKLPTGTAFDLEWDGVVLPRCVLGQSSEDSVHFTFVQR